VFEKGASLTYFFVILKLSSEEKTSLLPEKQQAENLLSGYTGTALKLLRNSGATKGSRIKVKTRDGFEATGLLVPRYEGEATDYLVLKLKSGYNIGLDAKTVKSVELVEDSIVETPSPSGIRILKDGIEAHKTVLLLSTGGTIASRVDYRTGAVKPAYTAADLYSAVPELATIASIKPEVVFSAFSENLAQDHWGKLSEYIIQKSRENSNFDGVVIMLGTDTMAYVSAALSFSLIGFQYPVVCVGSQRSSDRPSADSALNLQAATRFAAYSKARGVFVAMHENESDQRVAIHCGVRVRKNHTSRRNAFQSIDVPPFALVEQDKILLNFGFPDNKENSQEISKALELKTKFESNVSLLKFHPGFDPSLLDFLSGEKKTKGFILEGTGLGHVSSPTVQKLKNLVEKGTFVGMTSQCIWGHVDLNVYETGIDLQRAGVTPLGNMISETALAKLSWVLGNFPKKNPRELMTQNLLGEMTERIPLK
jgi:glutamyl-tRNA(Gln) amidotransferase subunit D